MFKNKHTGELYFNEEEVEEQFKLEFEEFNYIKDLRTKDVFRDYLDENFFELDIDEVTECEICHKRISQGQYDHNKGICDECKKIINEVVLK